MAKEKKNTQLLNKGEKIKEMAWQGESYLKTSLVVGLLGIQMLFKIATKKFGLRMALGQPN